MTVVDIHDSNWITTTWPTAHSKETRLSCSSCGYSCFALLYHYNDLADNHKIQRMRKRTGSACTIDDHHRSFAKEKWASAGTFSSKHWHTIMTRAKVHGGIWDFSWLLMLFSRWWIKMHKDAMKDWSAAARCITLVQRMVLRKVGLTINYLSSIGQKVNIKSRIGISYCIRVSLQYMNIWKYMKLWMVEKDTLKWKLWQEYRAQKGISIISRPFYWLDMTRLWC